MRISANLSVEDLATAIAAEDEDRIVDLIVLVDELVADWALTERLARHFDELMRERLREL